KNFAYKILLPLIIKCCYFEPFLFVVACWAKFWSFFAFVKESTVSAFPDYCFFFFNYCFFFYVVVYFLVSISLCIFYFSDISECSSDFIKSFFFCYISE